MSTLKIDWPDYLRVHAGRANLLIHLLAVPLFVVSVVSVPLYLLAGDPVSAMVAVALCIVAMVLQGSGHRLEAEPPRPFNGPGDFARRWFTEQFVTFPLFVISGRWWRQFRQHGNHPS